MLALVAFPGGPGLPPLPHRHRHAGSHLQGNQEALFRALLPGGRELHGGGLGDGEGQLQAEGNLGDADAAARCARLFISLFLILRSSRGTTTRRTRPSPSCPSRRWRATSASVPCPGSKASACASRSTAAGPQVALARGLASLAPSFTQCFTHFLDSPPYRRGAH